MIELDAKPGCIYAANQALGDKWTSLLIYDLQIHGAMTFSQLADSTPGISPRTLSQRLSTMEKRDIIERIQYNDRPVRYRYDLTKKGHDLVLILDSMARWGQRYAADEPCPHHGKAAMEPTEHYVSIKE